MQEVHNSILWWWIEIFELQWFIIKIIIIRILVLLGMYINGEIIMDSLDVMVMVHVVGQIQQRQGCLNLHGKSIYRQNMQVVHLFLRLREIHGMMVHHKMIIFGEIIQIMLLINSDLAQIDIMCQVEMNLIEQIDCMLSGKRCIDLLLLKQSSKKFLHVNFYSHLHELTRSEILLK